MTEKYPDLEIKCRLYSRDVDEYRGDMKCDLAVTNVTIISLNSRKITNLLNRTINVTELFITMKPNDKEFRLFPVLDAIASLPLKKLFLVLKEFEFPLQYDQDGKLIIPPESDKNKKYTLTSRDFSSLNNVLSMELLRVVWLVLDCVPDIQNIYNSFIESSNNNFNIFTVLFRKGFILRYFTSQLHNIRYNRAFGHDIEIDSLPDFDIIEFVRKFKRSPADTSTLSATVTRSGAKSKLNVNILLTPEKITGLLCIE